MYCGKVEHLGKVLSAVETAARALLAKGPVTLEVSAFKAKRTNPQNAFYWKNIEHLRQTLEDAGDVLRGDGFCLPYTKDIIHEINKTILGVDTTTNLSRREFCEYMDRFFAYWIDRTYGFWTPLETAESYFDRTNFLDERKA